MNKSTSVLLGGASAYRHRQRQRAVAQIRPDLTHSVLPHYHNGILTLSNHQTRRHLPRSILPRQCTRWSCRQDPRKCRSLPRPHRCKVMATYFAHDPGLRNPLPSRYGSRSRTLKMACPDTTGRDRSVRASILPRPYAQRAPVPQTSYPRLLRERRGADGDCTSRSRRWTETAPRDEERVVGTSVWRERWPMGTKSRGRGSWPDRQSIPNRHLGTDAVRWDCRHGILSW